MSTDAHARVSLPSTVAPAATVAVFAHFDPGGQLAPHVERYLAELSATVERLVVVSTARLKPAARSAIETHAELVERRNEGYDFYSWKTGLDHIGDWGTYDRLLICNDSVVGPVVPLERVLGANAPSDVDFWGMTTSRELSPHAQSWFVVFERAALNCGLLHGFWRAMTPISDRYRVIRRYEVGMSRLLLTGGLRMGSYLDIGARDAIRGGIRFRRALARTGRRPLPVADEPHGRAGRISAALLRPGWNPTYVLWDAVLDGRLPFVKLEVLRDDPYRLGRDRMLRRVEEAYPEVFAGVREYLERTSAEFRRLRGV